MYIYIYIYRERERERGTLPGCLLGFGALTTMAWVRFLINEALLLGLPWWLPSCNSGAYVLDP